MDHEDTPEEIIEPENENAEPANGILSKKVAESNKVSVNSEQFSDEKSEKVKKTARGKKDKIDEATESVEKMDALKENNDHFDEVHHQTKESKNQVSPAQKKLGKKAKDATSDQAPHSSQSDVPNIASTSIEEETTEEVVNLKKKKSGTTDPVVIQNSETQLLPVIETKELKKRGRKPKEPAFEEIPLDGEVEEDKVLAETAAIPNIEPKKRGRKPKEQVVETLPTTEVGLEHISDHATPTESTTNSGVEEKKKGRKPKAFESAETHLNAEETEAVSKEVGKQVRNNSGSRSEKQGKILFFSFVYFSLFHYLQFDSLCYITNFIYIITIYLLLIFFL